MLLSTHMQITSYLLVPPAGYLYDYGSVKIHVYRFSRASNANYLCNYQWNCRKLQSLSMTIGLYNYKINIITERMSANTEQSYLVFLQNVYNTLKNDHSEIHSVRRAYFTAINFIALTLFKYTRPYMQRLHVIKFHYLIIRIFCGEYLLSHP